MNDQVDGPVGRGRFGKFGAGLKKKIVDAEAALEERAEHNQETYGNLVKEAQFGTHTVEIYDGGYVRVGLFLTSKSPFEKLRAIKYVQQIQDKSSGGRATAAVLTMGLSTLTSSEKRHLFLTIATDRKVHTLHAEGSMGHGDDKTAMALEAAGRGVLDALGHAVAAPAAQTSLAAPDIADQIKKLADLHAAGILTDDEFAAKKAVLLDRM